jgi:hypothetical protein
VELKNVGVPIAQRELELEGATKVTVTIGKPEKFPGSDDYYCPYQVVGLGDSKVRYAGGIDGVQALLLALEMIGADLYTSSEAQHGKLSWNEERALGFPVPDSIRDLLPP